MKQVIKNEFAFVAVAALLLTGLAVIAVLATRREPPVTVVPGPGPGPARPSPFPPKEPAPVPEEPRAGVTQAACKEAGGHWNECGSACRGAPPGTACILICVPYCECQNDDQCPASASCGAFVDGTGVCAPNSASDNS